MYRYPLQIMPHPVYGLRSILYKCQIRAFQPTDLPNIMHLATRTLGEIYAPSLYLTLHDIWPDGFIVVESSKMIIGFILGIMHRPKGVRILMVAVEPTYWGQGFGRTLLSILIEQCYLKDVKLIELEVNVNNSRAINYYLKTGFVVMHTILGYYKNGDNAYAMQRLL